MGRRWYEYTHPDEDPRTGDRGLPSAEVPSGGYVPGRDGPPIDGTPEERLQQATRDQAEAAARAARAAEELARGERRPAGGRVTGGGL
jgi:hypothetical protein